MLVFEKIFSIISYYLAFYFEYINISKISKVKHKFSFKNIITIGIITIINYLLTISGYIVIKGAFSFISLLIISKMLVKNEVRESIVVSILYYILILIIEYFSSVILIDVLKYDPSKFLISVGVQKCIIGHIINLISLIICLLPISHKIYKKLCGIIEDLDISNKELYFFTISLLIIQLMYIGNILTTMSALYLILYIIVFIIFVVYMLGSLFKNYYLKMFNTFLLEKDKDMQKMIDEYKVFQHNVKNDLIAISSISDKKVKEMISDYMISYNLDVNSYKNVDSTPDGLKGVIYQKLINKGKLSTNIYVDNFIVNDPINKLSIRDYRKLVECFGIIIDNALEAISSNSDDYIYLYLNETQDSYIIKCINTFKDNINIDLLMNYGESSKKEHSGIGMNFIKFKSKFDYSSKIVNNKFCSELKIKK